MTDVNRLDRHIPLEDRIWAALKRTCRLHETHGHCAPCDERWAAIMLAIAYERDLLSRHDAIVETVVRDRITESKKAARYRLAWKSACQGRKNWRKLYEYAQGKWYILDKQNIGRAYHDLMMRAYRNQVAGLEAELSDLRLAFSEMEGAKAREQAETASWEDPLCGANPPDDGPWGDCWCTLPPGHSGDCHCMPCTERHEAPGWPHEDDCCGTSP